MHRKTVSQIAVEKGLKSFDCAIPVDFVHKCKAAGFNPVGQFVWSYDCGHIFGEPFPLTIEAEQALARIFTN